MPQVIYFFISSQLPLIINIYNATGRHLLPLIFRAFFLRIKCYEHRLSLQNIKLCLMKVNQLNLSRINLLDTNCGQSVLRTL